MNIRRERILTSLAAAALALLPAWFLATQLDPLLIPTDRDIASEQARQQAVAAGRHYTSTNTGNATAPLLDGIRQTRPVPAGSYRVRDFPAVDKDDGAYGYDDPARVRVEIADATENGMNKVVRLRSADRDTLVSTVHIPAGKTATANVPTGMYRITIGEGVRWYGDTLQFGERGRYYAPQLVDMSAGGSAGIVLPPAKRGQQIASMPRSMF